MQTAKGYVSSIVSGEVVQEKQGTEGASRQDCSQWASRGPVKVETWVFPSPYPLPSTT